jgi:hypothetical protein
MAPLSDIFSNQAGSPFGSFTAMLLMIKVGENALPLAIWQSRQ